ncbi:MAG: hypothetical protein WBQ34_05630, partial [Candidatus Acidiferrales bacterium]
MLKVQEPAVERRGVFGPRQGAGARHARPVFPNSQPDLRFPSKTIAGIFLFIGAPRLLWLFVVIVPLQIYRARKEERVLAAKFCDQYREYKTRT